jgi:phosphate transport system permease protein
MEIKLKKILVNEEKAVKPARTSNAHDINGIDDIKHSSTGYRIFKDRLFRILIVSISILSTIPLLLILYYIFTMGISSINWDFFFNLPKPPGEVGGGVANAIVGTMILIGLSSLLSIPPALGLGIYLSENKGKKLSNLISSGVEILQGIPSIVIGIIAYVWVVMPLGGFSAFSGAVALGIMMIPFIAKSAEETLKMIPESLKEASMALGVPYYKTVLKVVMPSALSGIVTGVLIAIARVAGETAPLLFTAFGNQFMNYDITSPMSSLPILIFNYAGSPYQEWHALAWGASFILVVMVLLLNIISKIIANRWKIKF